MEDIKLVGVVVAPHDKHEYKFVYKGEAILTFSNVIYVYCPYEPTDEEVMLWFNGTENIEKIVRYGEE